MGILYDDEMRMLLKGIGDLDSLQIYVTMMTVSFKVSKRLS